MYVDLSFSIQNITRPSSIGHVGGLLHLVSRVVFRYFVSKTKKKSEFKSYVYVQHRHVSFDLVAAKVYNVFTCSPGNKMTFGNSSSRL